MKNIRIFLSENFHVLVVKFSIYLNRRVFVMAPLSEKGPTSKGKDSTPFLKGHGVQQSKQEIITIVSLHGNCGKSTSCMHSP